jgi:chromate reductase
VSVEYSGRDKVRFLIFSASLGSQSLNTRPASLAAQCISARAVLMSASPSIVGGNRGLWALRVPFEHLGARVYPDMIPLAQAHRCFDNSGRLADAELANLKGFMDLVEASKNHPCAKKAWVDYLGEHPEPELDRVEGAL